MMLKEPLSVVHGRMATKAIESLEPRLLCKTPNDAHLQYQWGLASADAPAAWERSTGSYDVVVAHIDTGIDYSHPDLYRNIWINQAEIPDKVRKDVRDSDKDGRITFADLNHKSNRAAFGVNDLNDNGYIDAGDLLSRYKKNGNGGWLDGVNGKTFSGDRVYVDDVVGWDFANNDNDPLDHHGHGTHTAGVIGATGNNGRGVSGMNWEVSLMPVKIFGDRGEAVPVSSLAAAIRYSAKAGADVSNNSWGYYGGYVGDPIYNAIAYAGKKGQLFVTAAGNDGLSNDYSRYRAYPASYNLSNILSVAATNEYGWLANYSNYGGWNVDIAAPGSNIVSTVPDGQYASYSGTSMATPFVTGAAALLLAQNPTRTAAELKTLITRGADQRPALLGAVATGELNTTNALAGRAGQRVQTPPPSQVIPARRVIFIYQRGFTASAGRRSSGSWTILH
jgi:serine protease